MDLPQTLWEEIDFEEIELENKVVGKGTYGLVKKGAWKGKDVAVKIIETDQERRAFFIEVRQLSRVDHANIVKLYGACTKSPVCLVMEYAEGGSLYNVLHCSPKVQYTVAHAISWVYQCAKGVAYLHNMKPKALIHRDLKPPNLLLVLGGTILKICDFGTACDMQTNMTNNKGSAAWMAPEVFESSNYSEKCDVFSWGIILWEVLTRRKPFDEIGGPAFRIMWAVHSGQRPPLIEGCPKPLENLMTRCWSKEPKERPSMSEVEEHLLPLFHFFQDKSVVPIIYPCSDEYETVDEDSLDSTNSQIEDLSQPEDIINRQEESSTGNTEQSYEPPQLSTPTPAIMPNRPSRTSAPASLSSSKENLEESSKQKKQNLLDPNKRKSADFTELKSHIYSHRRTGSYGSSTIMEPLDSVPPHLSTGDLNASQHSASKEHICKEEEISAMHRKGSWPHSSIGSTYGSDTDLSDWNAYLLLEPKLQPLPPVTTSKESMEIYEAHRRAANDYVHVQTEITLLAQRKKELEEELKEDQQKTSTYIEEYLQLRNEKDSLVKLRENLKRQIEVIKTEKQNRRRTTSSNNGEDWVVV